MLSVAETEKNLVFLKTRVERVLEHPPQVELLLLNSVSYSKAVTVFFL